MTGYPRTAALPNVWSDFPQRDASTDSRVVLYPTCSGSSVQPLFTPSKPLQQLDETRTLIFEKNLLLQSAFNHLQICAVRSIVAFPRGSRRQGVTRCLDDGSVEEKVL
jgi:hypothetical protein